MAKPSKNPKYKALSQDMAAQLLAEAFIFGDRRACSDMGCSTRTLRRYKVRLTADPELAIAVREKKDLLCSRWSEDLAPTIRCAIDTIRVMQQKLSATPEALHAVVGAMKVLVDVTQAERILDIRLAALNRSLRPQVIDASSSPITPSTGKTN